MLVAREREAERLADGPRSVMRRRKALQESGDRRSSYPAHERAVRRWNEFQAGQLYAGAQGFLAYFFQSFATGDNFDGIVIPSNPFAAILGADWYRFKLWLSL